uniref:Uncharacterized protein n=1 Tax=Salmo trutta TaxID=8032 RepID=A0A673Z5B3_SALTR
RAETSHQKNVKKVYDPWMFLFCSGVDPGNGSRVPAVGNTWKFLLGVIAIALTTSMLIVCAVKSPSWYKLLFNYRHQRLRDEEDEDGYIEDRYIETGVYQDNTET